MIMNEQDTSSQNTGFILLPWWRYWFRILLGGFNHHLGQVDLVVGIGSCILILMARFLSPIEIAMPTLLFWLIIGAFIGVTGLRLLMAPYWIYKEIQIRHLAEVNVLEVRIQELTAGPAEFVVTERQFGTHELHLEVTNITDHVDTFRAWARVITANVPFEHVNHWYAVKWQHSNEPVTRIAKGMPAILHVAAVDSADVIPIWPNKLWSLNPKFCLWLIVAGKHPLRQNLRLGCQPAGYFTLGLNKPVEIELEIKIAAESQISPEFSRVVNLKYKLGYSNFNRLEYEKQNPLSV